MLSMRMFKNKFFKNSMLYTIGSMLTPMIGLIMLPIYTGYLNPAEYGIMTTVQTLMGMLNVFLLLSLHGAVTRFYYDYLDNPQKQSKYLGTIFSFVLIWATIISIVLIILKEPIGTVLFRNIPINPFYYYLIVLSWVTALYELPMAIFRAQEKAGFFVLVNILRAVLIMLSTIYLIVVKGMGAESALLSQFLITLTIIFVTYWIQLKKYKLSLDSSFIKKSLLFSLPLLPHVASGWIINSSDRIILEKYIDLSNLGIYALAVQVSMVLSIFYTSVNNALVPRYTRLRKERRILEANKLLKIFSLIVLIFGLISIPVSMYAIKIVSSREYYAAITLMPILLIGHMIKGFYFIPVAKLFYTKRTGAIASSSTIAAIANIVINLFSIPFIGVYGALLSTIVAEVLRYLFIYRASKKYG